MFCNITYFVRCMFRYISVKMTIKFKKHCGNIILYTQKQYTFNINQEMQQKYFIFYWDDDGHNYSNLLKYIKNMSCVT